MDDANIVQTTYVGEKIIRTLVLPDGGYEVRSYLGAGDAQGSKVETCNLAADAKRVHEEAVKVWNDVPPAT